MLFRHTFFKVGPGGVVASGFFASGGSLIISCAKLVLVNKHLKY